MGSTFSRSIGSTPVTESTAVPPESADPISTNPMPKLHFDIGYLKTHSGFLKIAECGLCLIGLLCVQAIYDEAQRSAEGWYYFVSVTGFWLSLFFLASYAFHVVETLRWLPWLAAEMGYAALWSFFFFIAASVASIHGKSDPAWIAAAFIGFIAMCIYAYEAFRKHAKRHKDVVQRQAANVDPSSGANEPSE